MDMQEGLTAQAGPAGDALAAQIATAERASRRAGVMVGIVKTEFAPGTPRCHEEAVVEVSKRGWVTIADGSASVVVKPWRVARRSAPRMPRCIRR